MDPKLITGTLEMLILDALERQPSYGYEIAQTVLSRSNGFFELKEGSLYPALHRLEHRTWLRAYWVDSPEGRRRKYYRLTPTGRRALQRRRDDWSRFTAAVQGALGTNFGLT